MLSDQYQRTIKAIDANYPNLGNRIFAVWTTQEPDQELNLDFYAVKVRFDKLAEIQLVTLIDETSLKDLCSKRPHSEIVHGRERIYQSYHSFDIWISLADKPQSYDVLQLKYALSRTPIVEALAKFQGSEDYRPVAIVETVWFEVEYKIIIYLI